MVELEKATHTFCIKKLCLYICTVLCILSISSCGKSIDAAIKVDEAESFFSTCRVENGLVYYECELMIYNTSNENQTVTFEATDPSSVKTGLLRNAQLHATEKYSIAANSTVRLRVTFVGEAGSGLQKADRSLPAIKPVICG